jgi:hypothetical protein
MRFRIRHVAMLVVGVGAIGALMYYMAGKPSLWVRAEMIETDTVLENMDSRSGEFQVETQEHKVQTERTVTVIRETVRRDIRQLDLDGLAAAALGEIELWRGSARGGVDSRPPRLDGD